MIKSFVLKNCLTFDEVSLDFSSGLTVFSGPSGAGKSILLGGVLASFGLLDSAASVAECSFAGALPVALMETGIDDESENIFRFVKKDKAKLLVNGQNISKKALSGAMGERVIHLSSKESNEFEPKVLLGRLDGFLASSELDSLKAELSANFEIYTSKKHELERLEKLEREANEQKEFLAFEIQKISSLNLRVGEDDELLEVKKLISKKEKTEDLMHKCQSVLMGRDRVLSLFEESEKNRDLAHEFFAELEDALAGTAKKLRSLDSYNIDTIMRRLEELSSIKKRYGAIEEALGALENKKIELKKLENLEVAKDELAKEVASAHTKCAVLATKISQIRRDGIVGFEKSLSGFLSALFMPNAVALIKDSALCSSGIDEITLKIGKVETSKLSSGEYRRARLALMCIGLDKSAEQKVLIVDEADANVSGEESAAIAKTLKLLSRNYQIFAISHQPQLSALADNHFFVLKNGEKSSVKEIKEHERAMEIARIVSGEKITDEAIGYAKKLLQESNC